MKALFLLSTLLLIFAMAPAAQAQRCTNSQFKGVYGAIAKGEFISTPNIPSGPTTRIGRVTPDGRGHSHIEATTSLNGIVLSEEYDGTYNIHPDCTADVILNIPFPGVPQPIPFTFKGVVSDNFNQMDIFLVSPAGSTVGLTLRQQSGGESYGRSSEGHGCSLRDLNRGYALDLRGTVGNPLSSDSFHVLGRLDFDGRGTFAGSASFSTAGNIQSPVPLVGTYTMDRSCKFTMTLAGNGWVFSGMLIDGGDGAVLIHSGPTVPYNGFNVVGSVLSGTLKQQ
ncbi:MAG: hypothetical protein ABL995_00350 [Bryobacteraceae bacterium]